MDLSVVIPCRNEARHIGAMLDSLARQTWDGTWEVVVADNGSTDGTPEIVRRYTSRLPGLRVVDASARRGAGYARNVGVGSSGGTRILFLDGDDEVNDGYVRSMAAALEANALVAARLDLYKLNPPWLLESWPAMDQQGGPLVDELGLLPVVGSCAMGVQRAVFDDVGGFRPSLRAYEDADLSWRIQLAGQPRPLSVGGAVVHYRLPTSVLGHYRRRLHYTRGRLALYCLYGEQGMAKPRRASLRDIAGAVRRIRSKGELMVSAGVLGSLIGGLLGPMLSTDE
jgi:glycosyltransferase involved in cell wall biosynthesis